MYKRQDILLVHTVFFRAGIHTAQFQLFFTVKTVILKACLLYTSFGAYLPQFFYSMLAPATLFALLAPVSLRAALALLVCVPLIPAAIAAVQTLSLIHI